MLDINIQEISNVVVCLKRFAFANVLKRKLQHLNYDVISKMTMQYIPSKFGGDVMFELPPINHFSGLVGLMQGMDKKMTFNLGVK